MTRLCTWQGAPEPSLMQSQSARAYSAGRMRTEHSAVAVPLLRFAARQGADAARLPFRGTLTPDGGLQVARATAVPPPVWFVFPGFPPVREPPIRP